MKKKITPKQQRFVDEYLIDLNATAAARRAGYSEKTAEQQGPRLLGNVGVATAIRGAKENRAKRTQISQDEVVAELAKLGFSNMLDYLSLQENGTAILDWSALTRDQAAAIQEVIVDTYTEREGDKLIPVKRIKFKLSDKRSSLVDIGRHLGMFDDKLTIGGNVTVEVVRFSDDDPPSR